MTLEAVRAEADPATFPADVLDATTALDFFGAGFLGRNSAVHLERAGLKSVSVIDADENRLGEMAALYPKTWRFVAGDAFEVAELLADGRHRADLVVLDPWTNGVPGVLERLPLFASLSRRWLVFGLTAAQRRGGEEAPDVAAILRHFQVPAEAHGLVFRSSHVGGVWWGVARVV